ncbi:molybdenum ABC transporter substrate-binding protein [Sphingomonas sp. Leaf17]|uniref:molybdate ABC transporter substrate-binding protein n=1 Tax=Sphingomonas sp. Leaf17 TaxID=1735683 RepID=UPI0007018345|nr:molybdate ABC transporter substrate-binding protein [Sphingomonas sp. Leaf17]KQM65164.1 molybdenum ABC transporter substrate-binding protein [Sphingomonas sp. Leaf17]
MRGLLIRLVLAVLSAMSVLSPAIAQPRPPLVLAAASLQESLSEAARVWAAQGHGRPVISFAASSALARQIAAGSPADIFISADTDWMDDVQRRGLIRPGTRSSFLGNRLVLIAPAAARGGIAIRRGFPLARALGTGRLAMADPAAVPAGRYGKAALTALGVWPSVQGRLAKGDSVRAALALVASGNAPYGIVYETDARASRAVRVVGVFPAASHPPITYPIAVLTTARSPDTIGFRRFLTSPAGRAIFRRFGFSAR